METAIQCTCCFTGGCPQGVPSHRDENQRKNQLNTAQE